MSKFETSHNNLEIIKAAGHEAYFVGGCVRDSLLGKEPKDIDIASSATGEQIKQLFPGAKAVGAAFEVVLLPDGTEVAMFRKDIGSDGRRPLAVVPGSLAEDAARRDFTINALYSSVVGDNILLSDVIDPNGTGLADLKIGIVKFVGDPSERIKEDNLRMLRALRFVRTLGFQMARETAEGIVANSRLVERITPDRVWGELKRFIHLGDTASELVSLRLDSLFGGLKHVYSVRCFHPLATLANIIRQDRSTKPHIFRWLQKRSEQQLVESCVDLMYQVEANADQANLRKLVAHPLGLDAFPTTVAFDAMRRWGSVLPEPIVNGNDILTYFKPGPEIAYHLKLAYNAQLNHPDASKQEILERIGL